MFINPREAIQQGWITGIVDFKTQVQPNAIDFTLDVLYGIEHKNIFVISEAGKSMRGGSQLSPVPDRATGSPFWTIPAQSVHDGMSDIHVTLPEGVAAYLIIRSTFNRNGIFITSGLYDSGFSGHIGFAIHNRSGQAKIGLGTRIGQIIFVHSEDSGQLYSGGYNHEAGSHWKAGDQ